ncbi:MAG: ABC transporter substrate-binding protein [Chloroflexi bacterium]|nr:ABC transporter substrate-binding protein [Chloroflexota bacterium]
MNRRRACSSSRLAVLAMMVLSTSLAACSGAPPPTPKAVEAPTSAPAKPAAPAAPAVPAAPAASPAAAAPVASPGAAGAAASPAAAASAGASPAAAGPVETLSVGVANNILYAPWFIGVDKGIFLKHGLDVKIRILDSGPAVAKGIQVGELDTGVSAMTTLQVAIDQGLTIKGFLLILNDALTLQPDDLFSIIAPGKSSVKTLQDLRGKKIGSSIGNTQDTYLKSVLTKNGIPIDANEYLNSTSANMPTVFDSGVDAVVTTEPYGELVLSTHPDAKLLSRGGGYVAQRIALCATNEWLAANKEKVEKLAAGFVEAAYITRTQREVVGDVVPRWLRGINGDVAVKAVSHLHFDPRSSALVQQSWDLDMKEQIEQKKAKQPVPFEKGLDLAVGQAVVKQYPQFLSDLKPIPG